MDHNHAELKSGFCSLSSKSLDPVQLLDEVETNTYNLGNVMFHENFIDKINGKFLYVICCVDHHFTCERCCNSI